jgi:penicillin-binding protein-related factor A (putative recombinase)
MKPGQALEKAIENQFRGYRNQGIYCESYHPERGPQGQFIKAHDFDYGLFYDKIFYAFDAKESQTLKWSLQNAKDHQVEGLKRVKNQGGDAFFLVMFFIGCNLVKIDVDKVIELKKVRGYATYEDGVPTSIDIIGVNK